MKACRVHWIMSFPDLWLGLRDWSCLELSVGGARGLRIAFFFSGSWEKGGTLGSLALGVQTQLGLVGFGQASILPLTFRAIHPIPNRGSKKLRIALNQALFGPYLGLGEVSSSTTRGRQALCIATVLLEQARISTKQERFSVLFRPPPYYWKSFAECYMRSVLKFNGHSGLGQLPYTVPLQPTAVGPNSGISCGPMVWARGFFTIIGSYGPLFASGFYTRFVRIPT